MIANGEPRQIKGNPVGSQIGGNMNCKEYPLNKNYIVYDDGRIYSKRFKKFLTPKNNWDGYFRIQIWKNNKCNFVMWHRIVAETFCEKKDGCDVINHINGNKHDNRACNIEWCTQKDNIKHAFDTGLSKIHLNNPSVSRKIYSVDLHDNKIEYPSISEASRILNLPRQYIYKSIRKNVAINGLYFFYLKPLTTISKESTLSIDTVVETGGRQ